MINKKHVVTLEYCVPWNYWERAARAADDILRNYQHVVETFTFITGTKGAFELKVDGELLYSKKHLGRHADPGEVLEIFRNFIGPETPVYPQK